jgi:7-carboxy-7-deazaguanine synthase
VSPTLRITEIFYSLQGEGFHSGTPAIFVRGAGCNLACTFCDTDFSLKERLSPEEIADRLGQHPAKFVVLTGGDPTIQPEGFRRLVDLLHQRGYYVTMETNGTSEDTLGVDWVTVSPKLSQGGRWMLRKGNELKLVYEGQDLSFFENSNFEHYFLQPKEVRTDSFGKGERDIAATRVEWGRTIEALLAHPRWKLSFQLHKELGLR